MNQRLEHLVSEFDNYRIDGFLVTDGLNMKYLTGFDGGTGDGVVLVTPGTATIITDSRYEAALMHPNAGIDVSITRNYLPRATQLAKQLGVTVLGFESSLSYHGYDQLDDLSEADIVGLDSVVETLRQQKDPAEIDQLKLAGERTVVGLESVLGKIHAGVSERQVAAWLDATMRDLGASGPSFETIVTSGDRSALPHGAATDKPLATGDLVTIDCGYYFNGYTSDMTRTYSIGQPDPDLLRVATVVKSAHEAIQQVIRVGVSGAELDRVGRRIIEDAGYGQAFNHGTGHGIGLAVHEGPALSAGSTDKLPLNAVVTVEPGIYLLNRGGVRLENDYLVTESGSENLTDSPLDVIRLD
ncbi:M24 family metallopeptidase [Secundilactobacillus kimchicus]|uniref:Xaa-Pro dipeptidase n=1 Tax=Secundilactobacillus kimchicus JCM 15530 TaxID=1302272 RepID=A0A0R1HXG0_9LACO|nr:Xaa-Pro peptidase family protein [Secundilactobacillus kimchicus]KRK49267.1 Xaa-Pro dipeptidase [Secundilactobacillus kimchicus JCM 15530]